MQGRDQGNVPEEVSFISTQLSGRYVSIDIHEYVLSYIEQSNWSGEEFC